MKLSRNYLTSEEFAFIVNEVCKHENAVEREIVKVGLIAQLLIEDLGEFKNCNEIYDKVVAEDIDFYTIINYASLEDIIEKETGVVKIVKDFVNDISERITKSVDNLDLNEVIKQLGEIANKETKTIKKVK